MIDTRPQGHGLQRNALYEERMARARGQQTPRSAEEAVVADRHAEVSRAVAKAEAARNEHKACTHARSPHCSPMRMKHLHRMVVCQAGKLRCIDASSTFTFPFLDP